MRVEREYWLRQTGPEADPVRAEYEINERATAFCEDPECESRHDDPSAKWDTRSERIVGVAYGLESARRMLSALRGYR